MQCRGPPRSGETNFSPHRFENLEPSTVCVLTLALDARISPTMIVERLRHGNTRILNRIRTLPVIDDSHHTIPKKSQTFLSRGESGGAAIRTTGGDRLVDGPNMPTNSSRVPVVLSPPFRSIPAYNACFVLPAK